MSYSRWTPGCCCGNNSCVNLSGVQNYQPDITIDMDDREYENTANYNTDQYLGHVANLPTRDLNSMTGPPPICRDIIMASAKKITEYGINGWTERTVYLKQEHAKKRVYYSSGGSGNLKISYDTDFIPVEGMKPMDPAKCPAGYIEADFVANFDELNPPCGIEYKWIWSKDYVPGNDSLYTGPEITIEKGGIRLPNNLEANITIGWEAGTLKSPLSDDPYWKVETTYEIFEFTSDSDYNLLADSYSGTWTNTGVEIIDTEILSNPKDDKERAVKSYENMVEGHLIWALEAK